MAAARINGRHTPAPRPSSRPHLCLAQAHAWLRVRRRCGAAMPCAAGCIVCPNIAAAAMCTLHRLRRSVLKDVTHDAPTRGRERGRPKQGAGVDYRAAPMLTGAASVGIQQTSTWPRAVGKQTWVGPGLSVQTKREQARGGKRLSWEGKQDWIRHERNRGTSARMRGPKALIELVGCGLSHANTSHARASEKKQQDGQHGCDTLCPQAAGRRRGRR